MMAKPSGVQIPTTRLSHTSKKEKNTTREERKGEREKEREWRERGRERERAQSMAVKAEQQCLLGVVVS
jgi:hypothetical protein